ncbi:hypothetical protein HK101_004376 [Irineochytrium annulatum]|nr:hypothetical protein HK101_004376 [Irineochytrium annulatum]
MSYYQQQPTDFDLEALLDQLIASSSLPMPMQVPTMQPMQPMQPTLLPQSPLQLLSPAPMHIQLPLATFQHHQLPVQPLPTPSVSPSMPCDQLFDPLFFNASAYPIFPMTPAPSMLMEALPTPPSPPEPTPAQLSIAVAVKPDPAQTSSELIAVMLERVKSESASGYPATPPSSPPATLSRTSPARSPSAPADPMKPHACTYPSCHKRFSRLHHLESHLLSHFPSIRTWPCEHASCGATFQRKHDLARHSRTAHGQERPHACPLCPSAFKRADLLKKHWSREMGTCRGVGVRGGRRGSSAAAAPYPTRVKREEEDE